MDCLFMWQPETTVRAAETKSQYGVILIRMFYLKDYFPTEDGLLQDGGYYLISDGNLVYNLSAGYGDRREKYTMRIF